MNRMFLLIHFDTYWLHATGGAGAGDLDHVLVRDSDGLPALSGKHVGGLLRDASRRIEAWGWPQQSNYWHRKEALTELLFGGDREGSASGCLIIPDFRMPHQLSALENIRTVLSDVIAATRIDHKTRTAREETLRQTEAAAPVPMGAWVRWEETNRLLQRPDEADAVREAQKVWKRHLEHACLDVRAVGGKRSRGFGRCRVTPIAEQTVAEA